MYCTERSEQAPLLIVRSVCAGSLFIVAARFPSQELTLAEFEPYRTARTTGSFPQHLPRRLFASSTRAYFAARSPHPSVRAVGGIPPRKSASGLANEMVRSGR